MKKTACLVAIGISLGTAAGVTHASQHPITLVSQTAGALHDLNDEKRAMDEAIRDFLEKNPPEEISAAICAAIEKQLPETLPESVRVQALGRVRENITPDIMRRMITSGLRRNFTVDEVSVLAHYDESQLSDELRKKNKDFRHEFTSEVKLLLAATIS